MATVYNGPCPIEGCTDLTAFVALIPLLTKDKVTPPHTYSVCPTHYKEQWKVVYSDQFGGITFDQYLKKQAAGEPGY